MKNHVILFFVLLGFGLGCAPESVDSGSQETLVEPTQAVEDTQGSKQLAGKGTEALPVSPPGSASQPAEPTQEALLSEMSPPQHDKDITGYDGIPFGITVSEVPVYLKKIKGNPRLYRVPTKSYYAYNVEREDERGYSNVTVYFKNGKLCMFKDVFDCKLEWGVPEYRKQFRNMASKFTSKWGDPDYESPERVTWIRDDVSAHLTIELPKDAFALPIVKMTLW